MATILVVDDHPDNREFMKAVLMHTRHEVVVSGDGAEALSLAREKTPDLVISDILMPVMDGHELAHQMRADPRLANVPVIFWTAHYLEHEVLALAEQSGVLGVIHKPSDPREILRIVGSALGGEEAEEYEACVTAPLVAGADSDVKILRREALIGALHRLSQERDPARLVELACTEFREVIGCACAMVVILSSTGEGFEHYASRGSETRVDLGFCRQVVNAVWIECTAAGPPVLRKDAGNGLDALGLTLDGQPLKSLLAIPISSPNASYGWVCLINQIGSAGFSDEAERVGLALAAHVGVLYEGARLQAEVSRLNLELSRQVSRLAQSNADLELFAYAISHDLKEPLRTAYNFSGLLAKRHAESADSQTRECVGFIRGEIERARAMIDGLLAYSKAALRPAATMEAVDPARTIEEVLENCAASIAECGAVINCDPLPRVNIPATALLQIFQNLVSNALKYRRADCPPRIHISARRIGREIEFAVRDNGEGIEPEHRERVFQLFQRLHGGEREGIGLGLAMCARLVQAAGGRIWVEPAPGEGSRFLFTLPAADEEEDSASRSA